MKKLFWLGACRLAMAAAPAMTQTGAPDVVEVRTTDYWPWLKVWYKN